MSTDSSKSPHATSFFANCIKVRLWVRALAVVYLVCIVWFAGAVTQRFLQGLPVFLPGLFERLWGFLLFAYVSFLVSYVAITGRSPIKFFPLAAVSWPFFSLANRRYLRVFGIGRKPHKS